MKVIITIIAVLLTTSAFAQAEGEGWYKQKSGTTERLNRVYFFNQDSGWVVGNGVWYKTTNGGDNWEFVPTPFDCIVADILDFKTAIATSGKYIKYTTDAGITWSDKIFVNIGAPTMGPLHAFSLDTIFTFVATREWKNTTDRGKTWTGTVKDVPGVDDIHRVFFENSRVGYATGGLAVCDGSNHILSGICQTTDGGRTWNSICTENKIKYPVEDLYGVWAKDNFIILVGTDGTIAVSRNGGNTWDTIRAEGETTPFKRLFTAVQFTSPSIGYIVGAPGCILKTTDGGHQWVTQEYPEKKNINFLYDVTFIDSVMGWAVGEDGWILHTMNGGTTWVKQTLPKPLTTSVSPEPFGRKTSITYELPSAMKVKIRIYDVMGKELEVIESPGIQDAGTHSIEFDASRYPEGTFHYQIETDGFYGTGKMTKVVY